MANAWASYGSYTSTPKGGRRPLSATGRNARHNGRAWQTSLSPTAWAIKPATINYLLIMIIIIIRGRSAERIYDSLDYYLTLGASASPSPTQQRTGQAPRGREPRARGKGHDFKEKAVHLTI